MIILGVCGASGSGKSTLCRNIAERLNCSTHTLVLDGYYRDRRDLPFSKRALLNYDSPDMFDFDALMHDIHCLRTGQSITQKEYDYAAHLRADSRTLIPPPDILLIEGIHAFYDDRLLKLFDLKIYMDVDPDVCILRRLLRDVHERGRTAADVIAQYLTTVKPMYEQYIKHYRIKADLCVTGGGHNQNSLKVLCGYLHSALRLHGTQP